MHPFVAGRKHEMQTFQELYARNQSAFVAVYGRRRVGKTYLVRNFFEQKMSFQATGLGNSGLRLQLANFQLALEKQFPLVPVKPIKSWFEAFVHLTTCLESLSSLEKKVVFLDELPWFDTPQSGFISALEHFWNSWASARRDVVLITCGSAASWMVNKLINNHGGLHNRVTHRMRISPFTLSECEEFFALRNMHLDRYQLGQIYMAMGGIPFYLEYVQGGLSAAQNIDRIFFGLDSPLRKEYDNLYPSLFKNSSLHSSVVSALASKASGMTRKDLVKSLNIEDSGTFGRTLRELEESSFIRRYNNFGMKTKDTIYQLSDFYSLFYHRFIKELTLDEKNAWITRINNPSVRAWSGYAFEQVCLAHLDQIKQRLGISGIYTQTSSWRSVGAQIDLVMDRRDGIVHLFEIKFSNTAFELDADYARSVAQKLEVFKSATKTKKSIFLSFIAPKGIVSNKHSVGIVENSLTFDDLFDK
jgi:uncharacterized protein